MMEDCKGLAESAATTPAPSGINESRVCYESWDEDIFINESADVYKSLKSVKKEIITERREGNESF